MSTRSSWPVVCLQTIEDPGHILKLADVFIKGVISFAINIQGTRFYRAVKAVDATSEELRFVARQRREALDRKTVSPTQDLLSHLLVTSDASGKFLSEMEIAANILLLLFAKRIDIAKSKEPGELLKWEDIQKMRYSWNVVSKVPRLLPPASGAFREAIDDFSYAGYTVQKGSKLFWNSGSTHVDPTLFPKAEDFDVSRFEGAGPAPYSYVPFGGGPGIFLRTSVTTRMEATEDFPKE
ncbi:hypothetical protein NC653_009968 [Populus alba x Populus x berolinensis]|uniref:Cytochrome P450 n=1 Tax=Populus alba x Populus x berolinensis TaxID=444605 RepID=A0AAD6RAE8_9ROSI|nr:hypothetical protein NC653_009968 [Populus alba x Populus x berolinensis]